MYIFPSLVQFVCKDVHQYLRVTVGVDVPQIFSVQLLSQFVCIGQVAIVGK